MVKMKLDWKKHLGLVFLFFLLISGCKSVDEDTDCIYYLNQKEYSRVASNTSCSTYERASAELGLAGFLFSNFLASGASDNYRRALGIEASATSWNTWAGKTHYENAIKLSGDSTGDTYEGRTRPKEDVEIHYFATLGALLALTYIELDDNANGTISEAEIQSFTNIRPSTDASYGKNEIAMADWMQFITDKDTASEKVYLLNLGTEKCIPKSAVPIYDGLWTGTSYDITDSTNCGLIATPSGTTIAAWVAAGSGSLDVTGECTPVVKIEQLQNLFLSSSGGSGLSVLDLTEYFVSYVNKISRDMVELGIAADSDLRKGLTDFSANIDNGATCTNTTVTEVDQLFSILNVAAKDATTDYKNTNTLPFSSVSSASDTAIALSNFSSVVTFGGVPVTITFTCSNASNLSARLIYKSSATYVPYYSGADTAINSTFSTLKSLNTDASGDVKPNTAGDQIVSFKELLCME
ncbi:MAG: hypothetical protein ABIK68_21325 [bacterium]